MPQHHSSSSPLPCAHNRPDMTALSEPGALLFAADRLPWQRSLRWSRPERDVRLLLLGLLVALIVTVLELSGFALGMRPYRGPPRKPVAIQVVLIEPAPVQVPPPPEPEPPIVARPSKIAIAPPQVHTVSPPVHVEEPSDAMQARIGSAGNAAPAPKLFNLDGSIRIGNGAEVMAPQAPKNPQEAAKARWAKIQQRGNPVDCQKTRFAKAFAPDEDAGDKIASKYLKWVGLADGEAIAHRRQQRAQAGGCDPAK